MNQEIIRSNSEFHNLKEEWNALLENSASRVPFLRHEFLTSWWKTLGGGEWEKGDLAVVLQRDSRDKLEGIAPFFVHNGRVLFLGSHEISDYLDIISRAEKLPQVIKQLLTVLEDPSFPDWQRIDLYNILDDSPSLPYIRETLLQAGYQLEEEILQPAPYISLPSNWDTYLNNLKPRDREEIEKKISSAEKYFLPVSWYIVEDPSTLEQELDDFLELMSNHPQKKLFLTPDMVRQMKIFGREAFRAGWLQLAFLQVGDIKASGYLNFDFNDQIWIYNSGINPLFENISPGWVLLGKIIQWAIEHGKVKLDFMRGDEPYKYQFGGIDKQVLRLQVTR
jgi:hypothetical protein